MEAVNVKTNLSSQDLNSTEQLKLEVAKLKQEIAQLKQQATEQTHKIQEPEQNQKEHLRLLNRLEMAETCYQSLFEGVADTILVADAEGRYQDANPAALSLLGYFREELLQMSIPQVSNLSQAQTENMFREFVDKGYWRGEIELRRKDGSIVPTEGQATVINSPQGTIYVSVLRDITERRKAEVALQRSEQHARNILDSLVVFAGILTPEGILIEANHIALQTANLKPDEVLGQPFEETYWWSFSEESKAQIRTTIIRAAQGEHLRYDVPMRIADGQMITVDFALIPILDTAGKVSYLIPSGIDISTRKELDYLKDLFLSVASHELRNPLTSIKGYAQLAQRYLLNQSKAAESWQDSPEKRVAKILHTVEQILRQSNRMEELVKQLLDFSRIQSGKMELRLEEANLVLLIERIIEQQHLTAKNHQILFQAQEKTIQAVYDEARMEQVLDNLINNAFKYSPTDTTVTVGIEKSSSEGKAQEVLVWVQDEGHGISKEDQSYIFDRFHRIRTEDNTKVEGLGLGLYVSYEIVRQHGGRMWIESQLGKGSTFYFSIPLKSV